jgi:hypothetical protein
MPLPACICGHTHHSNTTQPYILVSCVSRHTRGVKACWPAGRKQEANLGHVWQPLLQLSLPRVYSAVQPQGTRLLQLIQIVESTCRVGCAQQ